MKITPPGLFSRGRISLGPAPHITPDSLLHELTGVWAPQGFTLYKSALVGVDVVLKKSGWSGVALKIKPNNGNVDIAYNAFAPSVFVRLMAMGLIPALIVNANSWKPLLRRFEQYVQGSSYFGGSAQLQGGQAQLPAGGYAHQEQYHQQQQQQYAQQQQPQAYAQQAYQQQPAQYPCQQCRNILQWVAEHQRWYCGTCRQYI